MGKICALTEKKKRCVVGSGIAQFLLSLSQFDQHWYCFAFRVSFLESHFALSGSAHLFFFLICLPHPLKSEHVVEKWGSGRHIRMQYVLVRYFSTLVSPCLKHWPCDSRLANTCIVGLIDEMFFFFLVFFLFLPLFPSLVCGGALASFRLERL